MLRIAIVKPSREEFRRMASDAQRWYPMATYHELTFYLRGCCDMARYRYTIWDLQRALDSLHEQAEQKARRHG